MGIVEQATKRLEELRRAGVDLPWIVPGGETPMRDTEILVRPKPDRSANSGDAQPIRRSRQVDIDLDALVRAGFIDPRGGRSQTADEFRVIKRPLLTNAYANPPVNERANLIMVTSSLPGEGKTFTSVNLSLSIAAELDRTVLLVDADTSRPAVMQRLGLPESEGLLDKLTKPSLDFSNLILRTNLDKLALLPAGPPNPHATELLASEALDALLEELSNRYPDRIIIFDAPPLLPSAEARVLATRVGQVVMVVEAGKTTRAAVEQAAAALEECPVVLTLLNKARRSSEMAYGYYAY